VIKWLAQDENPVTAGSYPALEEANKRISAASGGRLIIETHPGDAIVPADTEIDGVHKGTLDVGHGAFTSWVGPFGTTAALFCKMVGGPTALQYYFWYMLGPGMDLANEMLASKNYNVVPLAVDANVPEVFLYTDFAISSPADLKGKKMRLLGDEAEIFGKLDVAATATPSGEIYESMSRGVIDGFQHGNLAGDLIMGFHEIVDYAYLSTARQSTDVFVYFVNRDSWEELPDDLKLLVEDMYWKAGIKIYADWTYANTMATPDWVDAGVNVEPAPQSVIDAVVNSANEYYADQTAADPFYRKVFEALAAWRDAYNAAYPQL
jgi:TRAP-type mannitol/chloroaromatic compound transport system substrate-binding protein